MNASYLASPDFLIKSLQLVTVIEAPVHWFGAYCIVSQTPASMKSLKWSMFNLHFWSMVFDWMISFLFRPFAILPAVGGVPMGMLSDLGVPAEVQYYMCVVIFSMLNVSAVSLMENRYYLLFCRKTFWRVVRYPFIALNYLVGFTYLTWPFFHHMDRKTAIEIIRNKIPEISSFVFEKPFFIFDTDSYFIYAIVLFFETLIVNETFVFGYLIAVNLEKSAKQTIISKRTYDLQKKLMRSLFIQIATPVFIIAAPLLWLGACIIFNVYNQSFNNICVILISLHGFFSTIVMLYIHKPYCNFCYNLFFRIICRSSSAEYATSKTLPMTNNWRQSKSISTVTDSRVGNGSMTF